MKADEEQAFDADTWVATDEGDPPIEADEGLVFAFALGQKEGEPGKRLGWGELDPSGPIWVHMDRTVPRVQKWLAEEAELDELVIDALLADGTRPRASSISDGLLVILRGVNLNKGADPDDMIAIRMWLDHHRVITLRQHRFQTVRELRLLVEAGKGPTAPVGVMTFIADGLIDKLWPVVENLRSQIDGVEDHLAGEDIADLDTRGLADVRRQSIRLRRYLSPQRDTIRELAMRPIPIIDPQSRMELLEAAERTARVVEDLEEVRDRAAVSQEEVRAQREMRASQRMYLLTLVAAVFLPLGLLTGLLGINVGGMPGAQSPYAFWFVTGGLVIAAGLLVLLFKNLKWL